MSISRDAWGGVFVLVAGTAFVAIHYFSLESYSEGPLHAPYFMVFLVAVMATAYLFRWQHAAVLFAWCLYETIFLVGPHVASFNPFLGEPSVWARLLSWFSRKWKVGALR